MAQIVAVVGLVAAQIWKGKQTEKFKQAESQAYTDASHRRMAAATLDIAEEQRNKEFMHSRALAVAAKQSGNTRDVGIVNLLSDLNAEGDYRIMARLYAGQDEAAGLQFRAEAAQREADAAMGIAGVEAITTVASAWLGGKFSGFGQKSQMSKGTAAAKAAKMPTAKPA